MIGMREIAYVRSPIVTWLVKMSSPVRSPASSVQHVGRLYTHCGEDGNFRARRYYPGRTTTVGKLA